MPSVSGRLLFDRYRTAMPTGLQGIANVAIVLHSDTTGYSLAVLTDANGNFAFINVPNGDYRIVEIYGYFPAVPSPGNFDNAVSALLPRAVLPPLSVISNPPPTATNLDCLSPNTILFTVANADVFNLFILNGPVRYLPIETILDPCVTVFQGNLITAADNGTMGFFPEGTPPNSSTPYPPYPDVTPDFEYVQPIPSCLPANDCYSPLDGEYTVQNIMTNTQSNAIGAWWRIADHTTGNETGRFMVVNGYMPGTRFFVAQVNVTPYTYYLFSAWILNMFKVLGWAPVLFSMRIRDQNGAVILAEQLGGLIPVNTNVPEWKQIGSAIYSAGNSSLTIEFISEGPAGIGNDYALDDVSLNEIIIPAFIPVKTVSTGSAVVGQTVTYTVILANTCESPLIGVRFRDTIPEGLSFVPGTVRVNDVLQPGFDPNAGFPLPDVPGNGELVIMFNALVEFVPQTNPAINIAAMSYEYTPVENGIPIIREVMSNPVPLLILRAGEVSVTVSACKIAENAPLPPGRFEFGLFNTQGVLVSTAVNR